MSVPNLPVGTKRSHYSGPNAGPFDCFHCGHFSWPHLCDHPEVIADAKDKQPGLKMHKNGKAIVSPAGCCEYERKS